MADEPKSLFPLPSDDDTLIRRADVPAYLGISQQTLARWAHEGTGPEFMKLGGKLVAYRAGDLRNWLNAQRQANTSAA